MLISNFGVQASKQRSITNTRTLSASLAHELKAKIENQSGAGRRGRKDDLHMKTAPLEKFEEYDCALIVTDHSDYEYQRTVRESQLVVDTQNATKGIRSDKITRC